MKINFCIEALVSVLHSSMMHDYYSRFTKQESPAADISSNI